MVAVGGSVETITLNGREFPVTADAEITRTLGGWANEQEENGDGSARMIKTRVPWKLDGVVVECDDTRGDHEFLQDIADGRANVAVSVNYASGETYAGTGTVTGDLTNASKSATCPLNLSGPGKLVKQ